MKHVAIKDTILTPEGTRQKVEICCDSLSDITPADPSWSVGSIAWVVEDSVTETGKIYGLKSDGTWVEQIAW